jgi:hypothetical protein
VLLAAVAHGQRNAVGPGIGPAVKVMHACLLCFFESAVSNSSGFQQVFLFTLGFSSGKTLCSMQISRLIIHFMNLQSH